MKSLSRADALSPEEKLEYLVLTALDPDAAAHYSAAGSAQARTDYLDWFWSRATGPAVLPRETYLDRAGRARDFFGSIDLLGDDRVRTYIRFGPPRREQYEPRPVETETTRVFVSPAEVWTYDSAGYQFDFVKTGTAFRLVGETRFGPQWFPPAFEPVDYGRPAPTPGPDARELELLVSLGRLRQRGDTVEVELQYGVTQAELARSSGPDSRALLHVSIEARPREPGPAVVRSFWAGYSLTPGTVTGRELFHLKTDLYAVTVTCTRPDGTWFGRRTADLNLVDYTRRQQPTSDALFYSLVDSTFQSPQFRRDDWQRVVPLIRPRVSGGSSFYVLYEVYNLATDSAGEHRAEATYELIDEVTRQLAVIPTPSRFVTGPGTTGVAVERVHTMDMKPGRYLIVSRVKDLNSGRTSSLAADFEILPRPE